jgi:hypothetical protein
MHSKRGAVADEGAGSGKFAVLMKWIGVATALLSFGSAVYGVIHAQADLRERARTVAEQLATGRSEQSGGDYPAAWDSLQRAETVAEADGVFAQLLGGLGSQRKAVRTAQEDLAMQWLRDADAPEGHTFSDITDKVSATLVTGANEAQAVRKADLLAHLGWAYFLKQRDGNSTVHPETFYQEGVAADANNPFANVFWGHNILWNNGAIADANERFAAALSSHRETATVRKFELTAFGNSQSEEYAAQWWRVVDEMHKEGDQFDSYTLIEMKSHYQSVEEEGSHLAPLFVAVSAADHVELARMFLQSGAWDDGAKLSAELALAESLEAAGRPQEALIEWRDIQMTTKGNPNYVCTPRVSAAIKRLSGRDVRPR